MYALATATLAAALVVATTQNLGEILPPPPPPPPSPNPGPVCTTDCSGKSGGLARRIVDGTDTLPGEYTSMVSVHDEVKYDETGSMNRSFRCGGVQVTCKHVVLAAHCYMTCAKDILPVFPLYCIQARIVNLVVSLNHNNEIHDVDPSNRVIRVVYYNTHPDYKPGKIGNDIMILTLAESIGFNDNFQPAYIPTGILNLDKRRVTAVGFGRTSTYGPTSAKLQKADLEVVSKLECTVIYAPIFAADILLNDILCTKDPGKTKGTCYGDSGSPLFCTCAEGYQVDVGITAFLANNECANPDIPSGNTEVSKHITWIKENTEGMACLKQCTIPY